MTCVPYILHYTVFHFPHFSPQQASVEKQELYSTFMSERILLLNGVSCYYEFLIFSELLVLCSISARASLIKQSGEKWLTCLLRRLSLANFLAGRLSCCVKNQEQVETKQRQGLRTVSVYFFICWKWGKVHIHKFTPLNWVDCCSIIEFWVRSFKANFINVH